LIFLGSAFPAKGKSDNLRVFYAGFAFICDQKNIEANYPYSLKLSEIKEDKISVLDNSLRKIFGNLEVKNFQLVTDKQGNLDENDGLSVAFALDNEMITVEKIEGGFKIVIDLGAQVLFFDFRGKKVIACYPIDIQLIDFSKEKPDNESISERVKHLFLDNKYGINIFNVFVERLKDIEIKPKFKNSVQVGNVIIEEKAVPFLPEAYRSDMKNIKNVLAQNFSKFLSNNQNISVLPYTKGHAIGKKMSARFANGEIFILEIPEAQYEFDITLRGFKKLKFAEEKSATSWVYGVYTNIKFYQPLLQKVYLDEKLKNGATKIVPAGHGKVKDWPAFEASLFKLFDNVTREFSTERKYKAVNTILEKCK